MKRSFYFVAVLALLVGTVIPAVHAQKVESTPVDLTNFWNADGWYHYDENNTELDPGVPSNNPEAGGAVWGLDDGGAGCASIPFPPMCNRAKSM